MTANETDRSGNQSDQPDVRTAVEVLRQADRNWEFLSDEERRGTIDEALNALVATGEKRMESPVTGTEYVVSEWIDHGDGNVTALKKQEVNADAE